MDMSESLWSHACNVDFFNRENSFWSYVEYFVNSFSSILQFDKQETNLMYEKFVDFQTLSEEELPIRALADAIIKVFEDMNGRHQSIKSSIGNNKRFNILFEVSQIVLLIPYSNTAIERLLSLVNQNKNESSDRNRLDQDKTLSSILAVKLDRPDTSSDLYYEFQPNNKLLGMAKIAVVNYNKEQSN